MRAALSPGARWSAWLICAILLVLYAPWSSDAVEDEPMGVDATRAALDPLPVPAVVPVEPEAVEPDPVEPEAIAPAPHEEAPPAVTAPETPPVAEAPVDDDPDDGEAAPPFLRIDRGESAVPLLVPRDEKLVFNVRLDLGVLGEMHVGTVTLSATVEPHRQSALLLSNPGETTGERGRLEAFAKGGYAVYSVESTLTSLILPQPWPKFVYREVQTGSENRRRELMTGELKSGYGSRFRSNGHCRGCERRDHFIEPTWAWQNSRHCKKCKRAEHRTWRPWSERAVPSGTVDMVSAVYLARSMISEGRSSLEFPMIDKRELWLLDVRRGATRRVKVDAGKFDATEVLLVSTPAPGSQAKPEDFEGLFGIKGTIAIWFDAGHGVPVLISGNVPIGPVDLDLRIELARFEGTPPGFSAK